MYCSVLKDVADAMRPTLEEDAWLPFVASTRFAEYLSATKNSRETAFDRAVAAAVEQAARSQRRNPVFVWSGGPVVAPCTPAGLERGKLLVCVDSRAVYDDGDASRDSDQDSSDEGEVSPFTMMGLRDSSSPGARRSARDESAIDTGLLTLCDERQLPRLLTALLLDAPVGVQCADRKRRAKLVKRLRALADAMPFADKRARCDENGDKAAVCRTREHEPPALLILDTREVVLVDAQRPPPPPRRAADLLVRAVRSQQIRALQSLDAAADETLYRHPLPLSAHNCLDAFDAFLDEVFFNPLRLFATRPSRKPHVVTFDLAQANALLPSQDAPFYRALFQSRRFAQALNDLTFWNGAGPLSPGLPNHNFSWVLPRTALDTVLSPNDAKPPAHSPTTDS